MNFFLSLLGGLIGILLAIGIVIFIIYYRLKKIVGVSEMKMFTHALANAGDIQKSEYSREKSSAGMTNLLEPTISHDFPEFNKNVLFSMAEKNLREILNCIESKDVSAIADNPELYYILPKIKEQIKDMQSNHIYEKFDNITFGKSAITSYTNNMGRATIKVATSISYYYKTNRTNKDVYNDVKKGTRYTLEYVYVYDETKFDNSQFAVSVYCKNCSAPIRNLGLSYCEYCGTPIERINLRAWKMASFKEDYN